MLHLTAQASLSIVPQSGAGFDMLLVWQSSQTTPRRPLNLSLVLDRSGSMAGTALQQAIIAATRVAQALSPQDTLSVVTYDDEVTTILPPTPVTAPDTIVNLLRQVRAGGLTNLSGGWLRGCQHVVAGQQPVALSRVLLLTDGQANVGIQDPNLLRQAALEQAEQGVTTTTLGFGGSFNEDLLIGMAQAGRGNYYFIQSPDDAADVFGIELESLRNLAAQNVTVRLTPRPGVGLTPIGTFQSQTLPDGTLELELGDVYEGEGRPLALSVTLGPTAATPHCVVADVSYTYQVIEDGRITHQTQQGEVTISVGSAMEAMAATPNTEVVSRISLLRLAQAKAQAVQLADQGNYDAAIATLRAAAESVQAQGLGEKFEIAEELAQVDYFIELLAQRHYGAANRKEMRDQAYQGQTRQRHDLQLRGTTNGSVEGLPRVADAGTGVELACVREGGRLRMRAISPGFDANLNIQFPRAIRFEGAHYVVDGLELTAGGFYRAVGTIQLLVRPGEEYRYETRHRHTGSLRPVRSTLTLADLETTDQVGSGVLVQCLRDGGKLRARVVSDGYDPNLNMRFPRAIRQEGTLYVVDAVTISSDNKSYVAQGTIKRFAQP